MRFIFLASLLLLQFQNVWAQGAKDEYLNALKINNQYIERKYRDHLAELIEAEILAKSNEHVAVINLEIEQINLAEYYYERWYARTSKHICSGMVLPNEKRGNGRYFSHHDLTSFEISVDQCLPRVMKGVSR